MSSWPKILVVLDQIVAFRKMDQFQESPLDAQTPAGRGFQAGVGCKRRPRLCCRRNQFNPGALKASRTCVYWLSALPVVLLSAAMF